MKRITYGLICEDISQQKLLEAVLMEVSNSDINFQINIKFYNDLKCRSRDEVRNKMAQAADYSFLHKKGFYCDVLFVGIDYDDRKRDEFDNELKKLYNKISDRAKSKVIIFFPVQAIEHWFLLLQHRKANPASTKNIAADIEGINRKAAKEKLYTLPDKNSLIDNILKEADFDWLETNSHSFRSFYGSLKKFIAFYK